MNSPDLNTIREEIDRIDKTIWSLLEQRFVLMKEVSKIKQESNMPILDACREEKVLEKIRTSTIDPEVSSAICKLYELLFALSRECQLTHFKSSVD